MISRSEVSVFMQRREKLMTSINGLAIVPNSSEVIRNQDSTFAFRFDSHFYYLTGFDEPDSILVLDSNRRKSILFCREKNLEREIWDGFRHGIQGSREFFKFDETYAIDDFTTKLADLLNQSNTNAIYYTIGYIPKYDDVIVSTIKSARQKIRQGVNAPQNIIDINQYISQMRLIKDDYDIKHIKQSCSISSIAHIEAMQMVKGASYEYEVEATLLSAFCRQGSRQQAYTSIVAGGQNACVLHYVANNAKLNPNDLLLVDAGGEYLGYASDITRTYPISGKFSKAQQAIYEIVLEANKKAIDEIKVGHPWNNPGDMAVKVLTQGLIDIGLLKGSVQDNIETKAYRRFYMHSIGHWLGLDVHDVGSYMQDGKYLEFKPGMCTTIEPGLYISKDDVGVPEEYRGIGVRIEDDILVTNNGVENLTHSVPKEVEELEKIILSGTK
jgi:Xaa-Pro aminopeptidase